VVIHSFGSAPLCAVGVGAQAALHYGGLTPSTTPPSGLLTHSLTHSPNAHKLTQCSQTHCHTLTATRGSPSVRPPHSVALTRTDRRCCGWWCVVVLVCCTPSASHTHPLLLSLCFVVTLLLLVSSVVRRRRRRCLGVVSLGAQCCCLFC